MSKNVKVNEKNYTGVSIIKLPLADGNGNAQFKDVDEIIAPSGTKTITTNGTHNVKDYASAVVNVPTSGGGITPSGTKQITENGEHDVTNYAKVNVNVASSGGSGYSIDDIAMNTQPSGEITITASKVAEQAFRKNTAITKVVIDGASAVDNNGFGDCTGLQEVEFLTGVQCGGYAFSKCTALEKVTWKVAPVFIATTSFADCKALKDIYVPWSESDVIQNVTTNAPWGATNATIHYNSV